MRTNILLLLFFLWGSLFSIESLGQEIDNYILSIDKRNMEAANLHVNCSFIADFQATDTICMNFGGDEEFSIENLAVQGKCPLKYDYLKKDKRIIFYCPSQTRTAIQMDYDYTNMSAFFIYGKGDAELWETSYDEYYYPYIPNTYLDMTINLLLPDSLELISSYNMDNTNQNKYSCKTKNALAQSLSFAFIRRKAYTQSIATIPDTVHIYQIHDMQCSAEHYNELLELTQKSIEYFSNVYKEKYMSDSQNITAYPIYLFHNGEGFSNRYNIGFISASQEKFSTYPDIYPLVHEIGHRWLGEYTLLIDDGQPGAYFLKESLNEFMTLMFIRNYFGEGIYKAQLDRCKKEYQEVKNSINDIPLIDITTNNNNAVVYRKGPLVLDRIAQKIGYDNLVSVIASFYHQYARKHPLSYNDFVKVLAKQYPEAGNELNTMVRDK